MDKRTLRREIGDKKRSMTEAQIQNRSHILAEKLFSTEQYKQAESLYAYLSINQEVRTAPIIERAWADGKRVAVPKIRGEEMLFIWIDSFDALVEGRYGIPEPASDGPVAGDETALMLMPGLAFDQTGRRIGYGGGFYDRYLARHPKHPTIALCYDFQLRERLEADAHDVPVDLVITDN